MMKEMLIYKIKELILNINVTYVKGLTEEIKRIFKDNGTNEVKLNLQACK